MAVLAAAQLLDELMGRNRNIAPNEKVNELNWEDPELCKYFLVKFCPHDLFVNTRADLGTCPKVHDEEAKKLYDSAPNVRKLHYQEEFVRFCGSLISEVERKITKGKQRLTLSGKSETTVLTPAQTQRNTEQINLLSERINGLVEEAEKSGTDGNVEQAQGLMKLCDQLKEERETLRKQNENSHWSATAELAAAQEKQMEVCDVCGAFLIVGDRQQRIDDHLMGKQHMGYSRLKAALDEIQAVVQATKDERRARYGPVNTAPVSEDRDRRHREHDNVRDRERQFDRRNFERTERPRDHERMERMNNDRMEQQRAERQDRNRERFEREKERFESYSRGDRGERGERVEKEKMRSFQEKDRRDHERRPREVDHRRQDRQDRRDRDMKRERRHHSTRESGSGRERSSHRHHSHSHRSR